MTEYAFHDEVIYEPADVADKLGFKGTSAINREIRSGRLRSSKVGVKTFVLGRWVLQWLQKIATPSAEDYFSGDPEYFGPSGKDELPQPSETGSEVP